MKILMAVSYYYYSLVGGTQTVVKELANRLCQRGHDVGIFTMYVKKSGEVEWKMEEVFEQGIKVIRWPMRHISKKNGYLSRIGKKFFNILFIPKSGFYKIIREYDILQFYDVNDLTFPFFSLLSNIPKVFFCATLAERFSFYKENILPRTILRKSADIFLVSNENTRKLLLELGIEEERTFSLNYGVDGEKYHPDFKKKENDLLLFVGAFEERKGVHVLLEALRLINQPIRLVLAGPTRDEIYSSGLLKKVSELNKDTFHKIKFLNYLDEESLIDYYQKASILICPSLAEEFGIVAIEALACGTPVVASRTGGLAFAIKHGEHGFLTSPGNPEELASAIELLLRDSELRIKFGKEGSSYILKNNSWDTIAKELEEITFKCFNIL